MSFREKRFVVPETKKKVDKRKILYSVIICFLLAILAFEIYLIYFAPLSFITSLLEILNIVGGARLG